MEQIYNQMIGFRKKVFIWGQILNLATGLFFAVIVSLYGLNNFSLTNFLYVWLFVFILGEIFVIFTYLFSKKFKEVKRFQKNELRNSAQAVSDLSFSVDSTKGSIKYLRGVMYNPIFGVFQGIHNNKECSFFYAEDRQNKAISPIDRLITIFQTKNKSNCPIFSVSSAGSLQSKALLLSGMIHGSSTFKVKQSDNTVIRYNPQELDKIKSLVNIEKIKQFVQKYPDAIVGALPSHIMIQRNGFIFNKKEITDNLDFLVDIDQ